MEQRKLNLKYLFLSLLALVIVVAAGYKYYEWKLLDSIAAQYNKSWEEETTLNESLYNTSNEMQSLIQENNETNTTNTTATANSDKFSKIISKIKLLQDQGEHYYTTTQDNQKSYQQLLSQSNLLIGNQRQFAKDVIDLQLAYYAKDMEGSKEGLAATYFLYDFFSLAQEALTLQDFQANAQGDESYYAGHLADIVVFKKYTDDNYQFSHQAEIKKYIPKGYDVLEKFKIFYATFYNIMEDYAKGDKDSAEYKASKLQDEAVALNVDPQDLLKKPLEDGRKITKTNIETITKQTLLIKKFETSGATHYPFLPSVNEFDADLVMCVTYFNKTSSTYFDIMDTYPKAKNTNVLLQDLRTVSPQTDQVDALFDAHSLTIANTDKKITFTCSGKSQNKKFIFDIVKNETK